MLNREISKYLSEKENHWKDTKFFILDKRIEEIPELITFYLQKINFMKQFKLLDSKIHTKDLKKTC